MAAVTYKTQVINESKTVDSEKCTSIYFENLSVVDATIDGSIPLVKGKAISFENEAGNYIDQNFIIKFEAGFVAKPKVLIIKTLKK